MQINLFLNCYFYLVLTCTYIPYILQQFYQQIIQQMKPDSYQLIDSQANKNSKIRKILCVISVFFIQLALGSLYTLGAFTPYMNSYIYYHYDQSITITKLTFILPIQFVVLNFAMILASVFSHRISDKVTSSVSCFLLASAVFLTSFFQQTWAYTLFYGVLYGFAIGFGYLAPLRNMYSYFPTRKGLCGGICMMAFGLGSLIFNQILQLLINPENQHMNDKKVFPIEVANNVPSALRVMGGIYAFCGIIGIATFYPNQNIKPSKMVSRVIQQSDQSSDSLQAQNEQIIQKITFQYLIKKKMHLLFITLICSLPFGLFIAFSYKQFGSQHIKDDFALTTIGSIGALANGMCRLLWGYLLDRISYKAIIISINSILLLCCGLVHIQFIIQSEILYGILVIATYFAYGGTFAIFPTQTVRILGQKMGTKIYPYVFWAFTIGQILQFFLHYFLVVELGKEGFTYCFIIFAVIQIVGVILSISVNYNYQVKEKQLVKSKSLQNQQK